MATRAGRAIVPFSGDFSKLQEGARGAISSIGGTVTNALSGAFHTVAHVGSAAFAAVGAAAVAGIGKASFAAARVSELNVVLGALARANNLSAPELYKAADAVKAMGIETATAQQVVAEFVQSQLDYTKAAQLARVAQDAAVIAGKNSTETLAGLMEGIQTQQIDVLRQNGIFINGQQAIQAYADKLGVAADSLSATQKQQAYLNAVLEAGTQITGTYTAAMENPNKQLRSMPRLFNDIAVAIGGAFLPAFGGIISPAYNVTKAIDKAVSSGGPLMDFFNRIGGSIGAAVEPLNDFANNFISWLQHADFAQLDHILDTMSKFAPAVAGVGAAIGALGVGNLPFIGAFLDINPLLAGVAALVAATPQLREALGNIIQQVGPVLVDFVKSIMPALQQLLGGFADLMRVVGPPLLDVAQTLGSAFAQALQILAPTFQKIAPYVERFVESLVRGLVPIAHALAPLITDLARVLGRMLEAFAPALPALGHLFELLAPIIAQVIGLYDALLNYLEPALVAVSAAAAAVIEAVDWFFSNLGTVKTMFGDLGAAIGKFFQDLPQRIGDALHATPQALLDGAVWIITKIIEGFFAALPVMFTFFLNLPQRIVETLITVAPKLVDIGVSILVKILEGMASVYVKLGDWLFGAAQWIAFTGIPALAKAWLTVASALVGALVHAMLDELEQFGTWLKGIPTYLLAVTNEIWEGLKEMGKKIVGGIVEGIKNAGGDIFQALKDKIGDALGGVAGFLHIKSPSLVFAEQIGMPIAHGIAEGIRRGGSSVDTALRDLFGGGGSAGLQPAYATVAPAPVVAPYATAAAPSLSIGEIHLHGSDATPEELSRELAWSWKTRR